MTELRDVNNATGSLLTRKATSEHIPGGVEEGNSEHPVYDFSNTTIVVNGMPMIVTYPDRNKPLDEPE